MGWFEILGGVAALAIVDWGAVQIAATMSRERTRRELFAYVAEGSITMADAERVLRACEMSELRKMVVEAASDDFDWDRWWATVTKVMGEAEAAREQKPAGAT